MDVAEAHFEGSREDVSASRTFVVDAITRIGFGDLADTAALLTSEVVTNAVLHAGSAVTVRVVVTGRLVRVEVEDASPAAPVRKHYSESAATGRGIMLVDLLGSEWGVEELGGGKRVWFILDPDDATAADAHHAGAEAGTEACGVDVDLDALAASLGEAEADPGGHEMVLTR